MCTIASLTHFNDLYQAQDFWTNVRSGEGTKVMLFQPATLQMFLIVDCGESGKQRMEFHFYI